MSGQLRTIKNRIKSVESTKKITRAMEMVAAAKLRRFQDMMVKARPFTQGLETLMNNLLQDLLIRKAQSKDRKNNGFFHPFFETREEKKIAFVVMTSDTGLCGSFNTDLANIAKQFLNKCPASATVIGVGKTGINTLKVHGQSFRKTFTDLRVSRVEGVLKDLKTELEEIYLSGEVDAVYVLYSHFLTLTTYKGVVEKILPFKQPSENEISQLPASDYIYEPNAEFIFEKLIPVYFESKIRMIFYESFVSEQIARMNAMHQATENAKEMIDSLVLVRNKARQASITKEIIEIVSGSKAQKIK